MENSKLSLLRYSQTHMFPNFPLFFKNIEFISNTRLSKDILKSIYKVGIS